MCTKPVVSETVVVGGTRRSRGAVNPFLADELCACFRYDAAYVSPNVCVVEIARPRTLGGGGGGGGGPVRREEIGKRTPDRGITRGMAVVKRSNRSQRPRPAGDYPDPLLSYTIHGHAYIYNVHV